jgi:hypothetical protein
VFFSDTPPPFLTPDPKPRLAAQLAAQWHRLKVARAAHNKPVAESAGAAIDSILDAWLEARNAP